MKTTFALYGSGWRAEFFLRVARALPYLFDLCGVVTRSDEKAERFGRDFGVSCYKSVDDLLKATRPDFFVVCLGGGVATDEAIKLSDSGFPVLMETPPAWDAPNLCRIYTGRGRIQIAEQFHLHPMHIARLAFMASGKTGTPQHAQISFNHSYHGISLIRKYLDVGFENCEITATATPIQVVGGYTRGGPPEKEDLQTKTHTLATLRFESGKTGLLNFETDQHRSWVRSPITQVKCTHGEIFNTTLKYLKTYNEPIETELVRHDMGREDNFEGFDLKGITGDGQWLYRNPFTGSRLIDDEISIAHLLAKMADYTQGGADFYSLAEGCQDQYLALLVQEAAATGGTLKSETQPWAA
jgi:predicted dehydrogenase